MRLPYRQDNGARQKYHGHSRHSRGQKMKSLVIDSYESFIVRAYCKIRFQIINLRMLQEIEQYMPLKGRILDIGCGFGLFSLYFALMSKKRSLISFDLSKDRISMARRAARKLGLSKQTNFSAMNVHDYTFEQSVDAIIILDLLHHLPLEEADRVLTEAYEILSDNGVLLIKEVEGRPAWKALFTWLLDKLMDFNCPVNYYYKEELEAILTKLGFEVKIHEMMDILPYPHVFYICRKVSDQDL